MSFDFCRVSSLSQHLLNLPDGNDDLFSSLFSSDDLRESVCQLRDKLEDFCKEELKKISDRGKVLGPHLSTMCRKGSIFCSMNEI